MHVSSIFVWYPIILCKGQVRSREGGIYDLLRNTGGKQKRYVSLHSWEGGKNDQLRRYVIFGRPL